MDIEMDEDMYELGVSPPRQEMCALDINTDDEASGDREPNFEDREVETDPDSAEFTDTADVSPEIPRTIVGPTHPPHSIRIGCAKVHIFLPTTSNSVSERVQSRRPAHPLTGPTPTFFGSASTAPLSKAS